MGLPIGHPLSDYKTEDGFTIKETRKVFNDDLEAFSRRQGEIAAAAFARKNAPPPEPGLKPLREVIPFTEGRAAGWKLKEHVLSAKVRNLRGITPFEFLGQEVAVCGGGPSLLECIPELRALIKRGGKIIAVNRTHDFLLNLPKSHGVPWIKPWAGILLEPLPRAAEYQTPTSGVRYYLGSQCAPETFDKFNRSERYIWHAASKPELLECLTTEEKRLVVPPVGSTCGLRAVMLAYMLGFRTIHMFGFDSCYRSEDMMNGVYGPSGSPSLHAYEKPETIHDVKELVVKGFDDGDRTYWGNGNMLAQADEFNRFVAFRDDHIKRGAIDPHHLFVHGSGLIPDMARSYGLHIENLERKQAA